MSNYYKGSGPGGTNFPHIGNTVNNSGGGPGESLPQKPIPGPESTYSQKTGTAPSLSGPGLPNRNTTAAGSR